MDRAEMRKRGIARTDYEEDIKPWPALKKALWNVVTDEMLNDGHYINAWELTDKLYAAALASINNVKDR